MDIVTYVVRVFSIDVVPAARQPSKAFVSISIGDKKLTTAAVGASDVPGLFEVNADLCFPVVLGSPSDSLAVTIALFDSSGATNAVADLTSPLPEDSEKGGMFAMFSKNRQNRAIPDHRIGAGQFTLAFHRASPATSTTSPADSSAHALNVELRRVPLLGALNDKIGTLGHVLLCMVPWAPAHISEAEIAKHAEERAVATSSSKRSWFAAALGLGDSNTESHSDSSDSGDEALMCRIAHRICHPQTNSNDDDATTRYGADLMRLMDSLRLDSGRQHFLRAMAPRSYPHEIPAENLALFVDVLRVAVRAANNLRDYSAVRQLFLLSQHYCCVDPRTGAHSFVYSTIRTHEAFRSAAFWETNFMDTVPAEQRRINNARGRNGNVPNSVAAWHQLDDAERTRKARLDQDVQLELARMCAAHMLLCLSSSPTTSHADSTTAAIVQHTSQASEFVRRLFRAHAIDAGAQEMLDQFIVDFHSRVPFSSSNNNATNSNAFTASSPRLIPLPPPLPVNLVLPPLNAQRTGPPPPPPGPPPAPSRGPPPLPAKPAPSLQSVISMKADVVRQLSSPTSETSGPATPAVPSANVPLVAPIAPSNFSEPIKVDVQNEVEAEELTQLESRGAWVKMCTANKVVFYHNSSTNRISHSEPEEWSQLEISSASVQAAAPAHNSVRIMHEPIYLNGERSVTRVERCALLSVRPHAVGTLFLTNYRLQFTPYDGPLPMHNDIFCEIPVHSLSSIEIEDRDDDIVCLQVRTKENRMLRFSASVSMTSPTSADVQQRSKALAQLKTQIHALAFPITSDNKETGARSLFAFSHRLLCAADTDGHYWYDVAAEFNRQGALGTAIAPGAFFITTVNASYEYAPTYPSFLAWPASFSDARFAKAANKVRKFRSKGRVPALTYFHAKTQASIMRAAQPLAGLVSWRCADDERLLHTAGVRYILDARPKANAVGNQAMGGGYEDVDRYACALLFCGIENIHAIRSSIEKVYDCTRDMNTSHSATGLVVDGAAYVVPTDHVNHAAPPGSSMLVVGGSQSNDEWPLKLQETGWMGHIRRILIAASVCSRAVSIEGASVLVHCSDGWDRTAQVCALAQLLLDPYFRTIRGFAVLIEKDWCSFGHKFSHRHGHGVAQADDERSPVFLQFLECVYQLLQQHPLAFEFDSKLLETCADHVFSCRFGTFLFDCERERATAGVKSMTASLWTYIEINRSSFLNPLFHPEQVLSLNCDARLLKLWPYHYRWDVSLIPRETVNERATDLLSAERSIAELRLACAETKSAAQSAPVQSSVMTADESAALKREASALQARIRALEVQNAALLSQISARRSQDIDVIQD